MHALPVATGGLEHRASVTMDIAGLSFEDQGGYHALRRSRGARVLPRLERQAPARRRRSDRFDYTRENYTRLLWMHEGFTDYMANVIMLRAGVTRERDFLRMIADDWPKYATRPGRNETSLDELSFEAWIKQYKPAENHINRAVSYYEKGLWTAMALDIDAAAGDGRAARAARDVPLAVEPLPAPAARDHRGRRARRGGGDRAGGGSTRFFDQLRPRQATSCRCRRCGGAPG